MKRLPLLAIALGLGGLVPFVACTAAILFFPASVPVPRLVLALADYAAVILSFLGAVHWGLALAGDPLGVPAQPRAQRLRLVLGVLPALTGWAALLIALVGRPMPALFLLLAGFAVTTLVETRAARSGLMPPGYLLLRQMLSAIVLLCIAAVLVVRLA
jgi:hypothetical protein